MSVQSLRSISTRYMYDLWTSLNRTLFSCNLDLVVHVPLHLTKFILNISDFSQLGFRSVCPPVEARRFRSFTVMIPSAAARMTAVLMSVPAFLRALIYFWTSLSTCLPSANGLCDAMPSPRSSFFSSFNYLFLRSRTVLSPRSSMSERNFFKAAALPFSAAYIPA